jgi:hypothetical protein
MKLENSQSYLSKLMALPLLLHGTGPLSQCKKKKNSVLCLSLIKGHSFIHWSPDMCQPRGSTQQEDI